MEGTQVAAGYQLQRFGSAPAWPPRRGQWGRARAWGGRGPSGGIRAAPTQAATHREIGGGEFEIQKLRAVHSLLGRPGEGAAVWVRAGVSEMVWKLHSQPLFPWMPLY